MADENMRKVRVGVFGTYGFENMGDAAVADATIAGLRRYIANLEILAICQQPENAELLHNVKACSIFREYIKKSDSVIWSSDTKGSSGDSNLRKDIEQFSLKNRVVNVIKSIKVLFFLAKAVQNIIQIVPVVFGEILFSISVFKIVRGLDLMVMSGSGQLNEEWGGAWRYPFGLFRWCLLARIAGCKIAFLSVGAGVTSKFWTRLFCATALRLSNYKSVRDIRTQKLLELWGIKGVKLVPDMAFSIRFEYERELAKNSNVSVVGINPISFCDPRTWNISDQEKYDEYIRKMSRFCDWLLSESYSICFIPNELVMDNLTIDDIVKNLDSEHNRQSGIIRPETNNYRDVFRNIAKCDFIVASRYHGLLFSAMSKIPSITLAHHYKFHMLQEEMGQKKYALDIDKFDLERLKELFLDLVENRKSVRQTISQKSEKYSELVEEQYRAMRLLI